MKKIKSISVLALAFISAVLIFTSSCSSGSEGTKASETPKVEAPAPAKAEPADPAKGVGAITHVELTSPLDQEMIPRGKAIFDTKCSACHKLSDAMLDKDPEAQKMLETCIVRMPNQGLTSGDCRDILEFMRSNDGQK